MQSRGSKDTQKNEKENVIVFRSAREQCSGVKHGNLPSKQARFFENVCHRKRTRKNLEDPNFWRCHGQDCFLR